MKRTVTRWVRTCIGKNGRKHITSELFWTRRDAKLDAYPEQAVVPCTITYDDGVKPKRRRGK